MMESETQAGQPGGQADKAKAGQAGQAGQADKAKAGQAGQAAPEMRALLPEEIAAFLRDTGEPAYRAGQIFTWLQRDAAGSYDAMSNIGLALRKKLAADCPLGRLALQRRQESADGTVKYLFALDDGLRIESVLMRQTEESGHIRHTVCLSSQAGCGMGCSFCATANLGLQRNLSTGEIVGQALEIAATEQITIHNAVYMGMGEPLLNEEAVKKSILILNHPQGQNIGIRRITVSTCGLPEGIRRLADWGRDVVLAVSLHAADDETRSRLMPVNRSHPLHELLSACRDYATQTGRRITFEYMMVKGVNTGKGTAEKLAALLKGIPCNINLIPVNPGVHGLVAPDKKEQDLFLQALRRTGLEAVARRARGRDIDGACGQLAGRAKLKQNL